MNTVWFVITTVVGGAILGGVAQLLIPGKSKIPAWATVGAGIIGMLVGSLVYYKIFGLSNAAQAYVDTHPGTDKYNWENTTKGIDWLRHLWQVGAAVIAVILTGGIFGMAGKSKM